MAKVKKVAAKKKAPAESAPAPLKPLFPQTQLKKVAKELQDKRDDLTRMVEGTKISEPDYATSIAAKGDDADIASQTFEKEMIFEISSNERETIKQIDDALYKIRNKTYGYCEGCRKPIPLKRLRVIPYTRYCLVCQTKYEAQG